MSLSTRRQWIEAPGDLSLARQCRLAGVSRSGWYYPPALESPENLRLMRLLDEEYTRHPFLGVRRLTHWLRGQGWSVNPKRVRRLLRQMGLMAIYPKPRLSLGNPAHRVYPYLLGGLDIHQPDPVWAADITYIRLSGGYVYLVAVMDWFSRYVLSWKLSTTLEGRFCVEALEGALNQAAPRIVNTDQGVQFTGRDWLECLEARDIRISMDGRGHFWDNILVERLWRSVKYELVYLQDWSQMAQARQAFDQYFRYYNEERPHQSLEDAPPAAVYFGDTKNKPRKGNPGP